eukprot:2386350-Prymnesium_polylepis.2
MRGARGGGRRAACDARAPAHVREVRAAACYVGRIAVKTVVQPCSRGTLSPDQRGDVEVVYCRAL